MADTSPTELLLLNIEKLFALLYVFLTVCWCTISCRLFYTSSLLVEMPVIARDGAFIDIQILVAALEHRFRSELVVLKNRIRQLGRGVTKV